MSNSSSSSARNVLGKNETLLERIKSILDRTSPASWELGGDMLSPNMRFEKPRQTWDMVFCTKISSGTLVVRCSLPIKSIFLGKGFQYQPSGRENFYVELRAANWHHSEFTDPYSRREVSDRSVETLATGQLAFQIFTYVKETYDTYHREMATVFNKEAKEVLEKALRILSKDPDQLGFWDNSVISAEHMFYSNFLDDCSIEVHRAIQAGRERLFIKVQKDELKAIIDDFGLAKEFLDLIIEYEQSSKLNVLSKVLEEV